MSDAGTPRIPRLDDNGQTVGWVDVEPSLASPAGRSSSVTPRQLLLDAAELIDNWIDCDRDVRGSFSHPEDAYTVAEDVMQAVTALRKMEWQRNRAGATSPTA
jgi:hypothetical protein